MDAKIQQTIASQNQKKICGSLTLGQAAYKIIPHLCSLTLGQVAYKIIPNLCSLALGQVVYTIIPNLKWFAYGEFRGFNVNSAIFQLYHGENKLIFNEMMMRSTLY